MAQLIALEWDSSEVRLAKARTYGSSIQVDHLQSVAITTSDDGKIELLDAISSLVTVASASMPMATSARLHEAMAWKVPRWFRMPNHLGAVTSQRPGSSATTRGSTDAKYGTRRHMPTEKRVDPTVLFGSFDQAR